MSTRWHTQTRQTDKAAGTLGNCTQAAVASLLGLSLDEVPDFNVHTNAARYYDALEEFFLARGYQLTMFPGNQVFAGLYLAAGSTERGTQHFVVMRCGQLQHDPHPSRVGLVEVQHVWVPVPVDPADLTRRAA